MLGNSASSPGNPFGDRCGFFLSSGHSKVKEAWYFLWCGWTANHTQRNEVARWSCEQTLFGICFSHLGGFSSPHFTPPNVICDSPASPQLLRPRGHAHTFQPQQWELIVGEGLSQEHWPDHMQVWRPAPLLCYLSHACWQLQTASLLWSPPSSKAPESASHSNSASEGLQGSLGQRGPCGSFVIGTVQHSHPTPQSGRYFVVVSGECGQILGARADTHPVRSLANWSVWFGFCTFTQCQGGGEWPEVVHLLFWVQMMGI